MALNRNNRLFVVGGSVLVLFVLMLATVDPETQHYIDKVMDDPESYAGNVHVRGEVLEGSVDSENFSFVLSGEDHQLYVDFSSAAVPDGFSEGKTIAVKGVLSSSSGSWLLEAKEIQTGCPSKYESVE
tara:strand:- start:13622 stop:14005 length:384 start_codon:yes stop_codon:yes gene_type:complete